jgi:hypothetical protein
LVLVPFLGGFVRVNHIGGDVAKHFFWEIDHCCCCLCDVELMICSAGAKLVKKKE